jgi:hypothetical protein
MANSLFLVLFVLLLATLSPGVHEPFSNQHYYLAG